MILPTYYNLYWHWLANMFLSIKFFKKGLLLVHKIRLKSLPSSSKYIFSLSKLTEYTLQPKKIYSSILQNTHSKLTEYKLQRKHDQSSKYDP